LTVLVDTSVWIDFYRGREPNAGELARLIAEGEVSVCGPIVAELIAGSPKDRRTDLETALAGLPSAELDFAAWRLAGEVAHELRRRGRVAPLLDIAIAVAAVRDRSPLWTLDQDFARIAEALPALRLHHPP
jgi:tRNA(fMet)-specific endonuclease VapC